MGERARAWGGVMIIGAGLLLIGLGAWRPTIACTEAGLILTGLGMGLATGPLMGLAVGAVSPARSGTASALINTARIVGATVGVAALGTLFFSAADPVTGLSRAMGRSEEHKSELPSLMGNSYAVLVLKKKRTQHLQ